MNQKGFANVVLIVIIVAVVAIGGYFALSKSKPATNTETSQVPQTTDGKWVRQPRSISKGASVVVDEDRIQVLSPKGGEKFEKGKTYEIRWDFPIYQGNATATIFLDTVPSSSWIKYKKYDNVITESVPARGGTYQWTVTQPAFANYKIDVYSPEIGTEFRGLSKSFSIVGGNPLVVDISPELPLRLDNLIVNFPIPRQEVTNPITIKGKARNIFFEGEFVIKLLGYDYPLGHPKYAESSRVITSATARIIGDCDWINGQWCDFEAVISYPSSGTGVENMLYFYDGGQGDIGTPAAPKFITALPIKLK